MGFKGAAMKPGNCPVCGRGDLFAPFKGAPLIKLPGGPWTLPHFLRYVVRLLEREINVSGLDTPAGRDAQVALALVRTQLESARRGVWERAKNAAVGTVPPPGPSAQTS